MSPQDRPLISPNDVMLRGRQLDFNLAEAKLAKPRLDEFMANVWKKTRHVTKVRHADVNVDRKHMKGGHTQRVGAAVV